MDEKITIHNRKRRLLMILAGKKMCLFSNKKLSKLMSIREDYCRHLLEDLVKVGRIKKYRDGITMKYVMDKTISKKFTKTRGDFIDKM